MNNAGNPKGSIRLKSNLFIRQFCIEPEKAIITTAKLLVPTARSASKPNITKIGTKITPPPIPKSPETIPANNPPAVNIDK